MKTETTSIQQKAIDTVRILAADAVQKANSGHPGAPMGLASVGHVLWTESMNYNPRNHEWPNRDRFILSNGHACMLQYSFLYLTGYDITLNDIKKFRQLHSKTAGHPEYGLLAGIEVTTGPLGQGFANGVGFAIAQKYMAARYNKPGFDIFNYKIYAICSDGDLMEGITSEAASLAGHLQLGNMIYLYDNNHITIEGNTNLTFDEDLAQRFEAFGWHVQVLADGNDLEALSSAIKNAQNETNRPSLIKVRTHIGYGSPNKADTARAHGSPLGEEEIKLVKKSFGFEPDRNFDIPDEVLNYYRKAGIRGIKKEQDWNELYKRYKEKYTVLVNEYELLSSGRLPEGWKEKLLVFKTGEKIATRKASEKVLNVIADYLPNLIGGSADLAPSTYTDLEKYKSFSVEDRNGRNFHFGIREHAMGAILNGLALSKIIIPYGATFLIFSEYMRPPIRLAAIMKIRPIFIYTHDSIGLGEDGTTHQPVEHQPQVSIGVENLFRNTENGVQQCECFVSSSETNLAKTRECSVLVGAKIYCLHCIFETTIDAERHDTAADTTTEKCTSSNALANLPPRIIRKQWRLMHRESDSSFKHLCLQHLIRSFPTHHCHLVLVDASESSATFHAQLSECSFERLSLPGSCKVEGTSQGASSFSCSQGVESFDCCAARNKRACDEASNINGCGVFFVVVRPVLVYVT